jgi:hypothetical protein
MIIRITARRTLNIHTRHHLIHCSNKLLKHLIKNSMLMNIRTIIGQYVKIAIVLASVQTCFIFNTPPPAIGQALCFCLCVFSSQVLSSVVRVLCGIQAIKIINSVTSYRTESITIDDEEDQFAQLRIQVKNTLSHTTRKKLIRRLNN